MRGKNATNSTVIDSKTGDEKIANHLKNIYSNLYNSVISDNALGELLDQVNNEITVDSLNDVDKINGDLIKEAIGNLVLEEGEPLEDEG